MYAGQPVKCSGRPILEQSRAVRPHARPSNTERIHAGIVPARGTAEIQNCGETQNWRLLAIVCKLIKTQHNWAILCIFMPNRAARFLVGKQMVSARQWSSGRGISQLFNLRLKLFNYRRDCFYQAGPCRRHMLESQLMEWDVWGQCLITPWSTLETPMGSRPCSWYHTTQWIISQSILLVEQICPTL